MKKGFEIAFGIALFILSVIATIWADAEFVESIIYAVVIPSFILSLISFLSEISEKCEKDAGDLSNLEKKVSDLVEETADEKLKQYEAGNHEIPYVKGHIPADIYEAHQESLEYMKKAVVSQGVQLFCTRCKNLCDKITVGCYVLLVLSLSLSPYIARWLSFVNLNCITMWSLALLYVSLELKTEICAWIYNILRKRSEKRITEEVLCETQQSEKNT